MDVVGGVKRFYRRLINHKSGESSSSFIMLDDIVKKVLCMIIMDPKFEEPVYVNGMSNKEQAEFFGKIFPLQYIWNEYRTPEGHVGFNYSINGSVIGCILEDFISRFNSNFIKARDQIIYALHSSGLKEAQRIILSSQQRPSEVFKQHDYLVLVQPNCLAKPVINYDGGFVTRQLVEEAIDFMISLEPIDCNDSDTELEHHFNMRQHEKEISKAQQIFKTYGEQTLDDLQELIDSIIESEKYASSIVYQSVAYSCLTRPLVEIGRW